MEAYPDLWPETVRALIVHSAEWTDAMKDAHLPTSSYPSKGNCRNLLRRCGFGVPDLYRALWSVANSLTIVVEETLFPFERGASGRVVTREMQIHSRSRQSGRHSGLSHYWMVEDAPDARAL